MKVRGLPYKNICLPEGFSFAAAHAGIKASGYRPEHVRDKLLRILDANGKRRIDLIIGTHYDEDHLNWPAPGSEDTELGVFMGPEVRHGEAKVYARVQA